MELQCILQPLVVIYEQMKCSECSEETMYATFRSGSLDQETNKHAYAPFSSDLTGESTKDYKITYMDSIK
jgi:hypothetical protein